MVVLVAESPSGAILGTITGAPVVPPGGHLRGMAVRPAAQGTGVAEELLRAALEALRARGCQRVTLDTTMPLTRAARFYERHGFRKTGRVTDFFGMPLVEYARSIA